MRKQKILKVKVKKLDGNCYHCRRDGHIHWDCTGRKFSNNRKYEKVRKAINRDKNDPVLCFLTMGDKKENIKKKGQFMADVKQTSGAGMM